MVLGRAYSLVGDQDEAIATLRESVQREPDSILPKPWLVNALIEDQLTDEARSASADILRVEPGFSQSTWAQGMGFKNLVVVKRLTDNLAKAGLPE
jgi:hypothetical protein